MLLDVGDNIYNNNRTGRYKITRVTAKRAYVENQDNRVYLEFNRDIGDNNFFRSRGDQDKWSFNLYYLETPELRAEYEYKQLKTRFDQLDKSTLTASQLSRIRAVAGETKG